LKESEKEGVLLEEDLLEKGDEFYFEILNNF
jgi:hypothetical protein